MAESLVIACAVAMAAASPYIVLFYVYMYDIVKLHSDAFCTMYALTSLCPEFGARLLDHLLAWHLKF